jgi:hypothetical protein
MKILIYRNVELKKLFENFDFFILVKQTLSVHNKNMFYNKLLLFFWFLDSRLTYKQKYQKNNLSKSRIIHFFTLLLN